MGSCIPQMVWELSLQSCLWLLWNSLCSFTTAQHSFFLRSTILNYSWLFASCHNVSFLNFFSWNLRKEYQTKEFLRCSIFKPRLWLPLVFRLNFSSEDFKVSINLTWPLNIGIWRWNQDIVSSVVIVIPNSERLTDCHRMQRSGYKKKKKKQIEEKLLWGTSQEITV